MFEEFDFDGNGSLSLEEFERAISNHLECSLTPNELRVLFGNGPLFANQQLNYREWNWIFFGKTQILKQWKRAGQRSYKSTRRFFQEVRIFVYYNRQQNTAGLIVYNIIEAIQMQQYMQLTIKPLYKKNTV